MKFKISLLLLTGLVFSPLTMVNNSNNTNVVNSFNKEKVQNAIVVEDANKGIVSVTRLNDLLTAINDDGVKEIIIDQTITVSDQIIDGRGKTLRSRYVGVDEYGNSNSTNLMESIVLLDCTDSLNTKLSNFKIMTGNPLYVFGGIDAYSQSGAIRASNAYVQLDNIEFSNSFRGIYGDKSSLNIKNCNFYRNLGGAGAAILTMSGYYTKVDNCSFVENKTLYNNQGGGAIENNRSELYVNNSVFLNNTSQENGGAINNFGGSCFILNSTITGNTSFNLYDTTPRKIYGAGIYSIGAYGVVDLVIVNSIVDYNYQYYEMSNNPNNSSIVANDIYVSDYVKCSFYYSTIGSYTFKESTTITHDEYSLTSSPTDLETPYFKNLSSYRVNLSESFYSNQSLKRPILSTVTPFDNTNFVTAYAPLNDAADVATLKGCRTIFDVRFTILTSTTYGISSYFAYEKDGVLTQIQNTFAEGTQVSTTFVDTFFENKIINRTDDKIYRGASYISSFDWSILRKTKTTHGNIAGISYLGDSYINGTSVTINAVPDDGYAFSKREDGSTDSSRIVTLNGNTIVSATFVVGYKVTYDPGAYGLGNIYPTSGIEGAIIKLSSEKFTRNRYIQDGWTSSINGKKEYPLGKKIMLLEDMTLYPTWAHEYSINNCIYNDDGTYTLTYEDGFIETLDSIPSPGGDLINGLVDPTSTIGNNGDSYLNTTTWDYFIKYANYWIKLGNTKGADGNDGLNGVDGNDGLNGVDGTKVITGTIDPTTEGVVGDTYINTTTWDVFIKDGTGWVKTGNIKGNDGVDGIDGTNGTNGVDGKDGSIIISADTVPGPTLGNDGDHYINTSTWDYYTKSSGRWILMGNIKGADGVDGNNGQDGQTGSSLLTGSTTPSNTLGNDGDSYVDTTTWDYYIKSNNAWVKIGNIKGADGLNGVNGTNGNTILTGTTIPLDTLGNDGDSYVDTSTWDYYVKANGSWTRVGSIKGIDGLNGTNGSDGVDGNDGLNGTNGTKVITGTIDPTTEGVVGDTYINTTTWDVFIKDGTGWVKTGNIKGNDGVDGKDGVDGQNGTNGTNGINGADGTFIRSGDVSPVDTLGNDGDSYINTTTWDYYVKANGTWTKVGNIKGADGINGVDGVNGANGSAIITGTIDPTTSGEVGDVYVNTTSWDIFVKENDGWKKTGNIKGKNGLDGTNGTSGVDGTNGVDGVDGNDGKSYTALTVVSYVSSAIALLSIIGFSILLYSNKKKNNSSNKGE